MSWSRIISMETYDKRQMKRYSIEVDIKEVESGSKAKMSS